MSRKPIKVEIFEEAGKRYIVLIYANGELHKKLVDPDQKARRHPRRPQTRLKLPDQARSQSSDHGAWSEEITLRKP
jgi:hypothetical protein